MKLIFSALLCAAVSGCAVSSSIVPAATSKSAFSDSVYSGETSTLNVGTPTGEQYRVFKQGAHGGTSPLALRDELDRSASDFCRAMGKESLLLRQTASTPPYLLGNFPKVELVFECIAPGPARTAPVAPGANDKYTDLARLKKLLDDGVITQQEFQREKDKILSRP